MTYDAAMKLLSARYERLIREHGPAALPGEISADGLLKPDVGLLAGLVVVLETLRYGKAGAVVLGVMADALARYNGYPPGALDREARQIVDEVVELGPGRPVKTQAEDILARTFADMIRAGAFYLLPTKPERLIDVIEALRQIRERRAAQVAEVVLQDRISVVANG